jgi:hypothetical protein
MSRAHGELRPRSAPVVPATRRGTLLNLRFAQDRGGCRRPDGGLVRWRHHQIQPFVIANPGGANDGQIAGARILNEFVHGSGAFDT